MPVRLLRGMIVLAVMAGVSACVPGGIDPTGAPATRAASVAGGAVVLAGPQGYCIDRGRIRERESTVFALFGTCAALSGAAGSGQPSRPAILTASVAPGAPDGFEASFPQLATFFRSEPGRAALSRSGKASSVVVDRISSRGSVLYLHVQDTAGMAGQSVEPDYWRAVFAVRGHMVSLSVMSLESAPVGDAEKRQILAAFVAAVQGANAGRAPAS
ncbi:MAG: hypothetical protein KDE00_03090 [Rhodobacteraceae bacterium]|nr:hypothetical protein [Paracoccaceae bacterium]